MSKKLPDIYKPHPKQREFLESDEKMVLYSGGMPHRAGAPLIFLLNREMTHIIAQERTTMKGHVRTMRADKGFAFIAGSNGQDYFFHRDNFNGHWDDLVTDFNSRKEKIKVSFEPTTGAKGPRAENVIRLDSGAPDLSTQND